MWNDSVNKMDDSLNIIFFSVSLYFFVRLFVVVWNSEENTNWDVGFFCCCACITFDREKFVVPFFRLRPELLAFYYSAAEDIVVVFVSHEMERMENNGDNKGEW